MKLNELHDNPNASRNRTRVGRGIGSGLGKTAGRGHKGQKSRSGSGMKGFEGGQMPLYRRLPKRGFKNPFSKKYSVVNIGALQKAIDRKKLNPGKTISAEVLLSAGLIKRIGDGLRLLGNGELKTKVVVEAIGATKGALAGIEKAGGSINLIKVVGNQPVENTRDASEST
ncbi:MAG: 50S ribosomal protein L15 [Rhodospirillaceae bacterium]|nr:50S ribosomal protein L15 [Rhodospirillaceae bacterium]|tara:strand:- start:385 stop:894 length:510 start_codon:yes stop_codon:yes gene_type:complete